MGGNALSKPGIRLASGDYEAFVGRINDALTTAGLRHHFSTVRAYHNKKDFGDCDMLCDMPPESFSAFLEQSTEILGAVEKIRNGPVTSFGIPWEDGLFQLDVIYCHGHSRFAHVYFDFNDLGNLMGRIAHKLGFKYGHDGLRYVMRDPENLSRVVADIKVTDAPSKAFEFLGYSWQDYMEGRDGGFQELVDVFDFVVTTKYFTPDIYLLDNRNAKSRVRDSKRKSYMSFLEYCEHMTPVEVDYQPLREQAFKDSLLMFPDFATEFDAAVLHHQDTIEFKKVYNGDIVRRVTGLEGAALGEFMAGVRAKWGTEAEFRAGIRSLMQGKFTHDIWLAELFRDAL